MPLLDVNISWFWRFLKGFQTIGTWFLDNPNAAVAWLALLIATSAFIYQVFQDQRLPNSSKVEEWMAYNDFRQYCQSQFDKGILRNDCSKTLALPMKAPPLTDTEVFSQNQKLFSRSRLLAKRTAASIQADLGDDHTSGLSNLDLDAEAHTQSSSAGFTFSRTQRHPPGSTAAAIAQDVPMYVGMGYLPLIALAVVLLYICLYTLSRRRHLSRQPLAKGFFKRHVRVHSSMRTATLITFAAEDLELGYGERHSVGDQIVNEIMGTSGRSADFDIDGAMTTHMR